MLINDKEIERKVYSLVLSESTTNGPHGAKEHN